MRKGLLLFAMAIAISPAQEAGFIFSSPNSASPAAVNAPVAKPEDLCTIEGKALNIATGAPVKNATLTLSAAEPPRNPSGPPASYTATTDSSGAFTIKEIEPGAYMLRVNPPGFVGTFYGARKPQMPGTTLRLAPKQHMTGVDFKLTPHGVITGHVLGVDREPVMHAQVTALLQRYVNGRRQLTPAGGGSSNDLGEYRIFGLAPGHYYLSATLNRGFNSNSPVSSASSQPEEAYVTTYYPGTTDSKSAASLDVAAGAALQIDLALAKSRVVRVRGRVINRTGVTSQTPISVMLIPADQQFFMGGPNSLASGPEGRFEIRGVAPGRYDVTAIVRDGANQFTARQTVDAGAGNVDDLILQVTTNLEIRGEVRAAEESETLNLASMHVRLFPDGMTGPMFGGQPMAKVNADGTFVLANVAPSKYVVAFNGLPQGYFISSIRLGEQEALEAGVDLSSGAAAPLHIVLSGKAGDVSGSVTKDEEKAAPGAMVVLVPESPARRTRPGFYRSMATDQQGQFTIRNLDPGDYQVFAWEEIEFGAWMDPDVMEKVKGKGTKITVAPSGKTNIQVKSIAAQ